MVILTILFSLLCVNVIGHGAMTIPAPRASRNVAYPGNPQRGVASGPGCVGQACLWFIVGCHSGCQNCTATGKDMYDQPPDYCKHPKEPTLPDSFRTWNIGNATWRGDDWGKYRPWRAPGSAPNANPCGMASGYKAPYKTEIPDGFEQFANGTSIPPLDAPPVVWKVGKTAEVGWAVWANHGGGYSYRLVKSDSELTEKNFQKHHLDFASNQTKIRYVDGSPDQIIPGPILDVGTTPKNSHWKKNPVPACNCDLGEDCYPGKSPGGSMYTPYKIDTRWGSKCPSGLQFEPVGDDIYGYGGASGGKGAGDNQLMWSIVDEIRVPRVEPGRYMLSFRWDCEQTSQVWNQCADVIIQPEI